VNPTKSTKSTAHIRRSATATVESSGEPGALRFGAPVDTGTDDTGEPQLAQKGLPAMSSAPHEGHGRAIAAPQFAQNGLLSGVSPWHDQHCIVSPWLGILRD
jgi:hypothetical protein